MLTRSKKRSSDGNNSVDAHVKEKKQKKDQEQSPVQFNAMRMQQNQTNNETIAETPNATQSPENDIHDSINSAELLSCYNAIQKVLTLKYVNANERLKLSFPAKCTQALMECSQNHTRNAVSNLIHIYISCRSVSSNFLFDFHRKLPCRTT